MKNMTNEEWLAAQPKKCVAVKALFESEKGNILLVKPTYKDTWQMPGGGVEADEDPKAALVREVSEELGITITENDLTILDTAHEKIGDVLTIIYKYKQVVNEDSDFVLPADEIERLEFVAKENVITRLPTRYQNFCSVHVVHA